MMKTLEDFEQPLAGESLIDAHTLIVRAARSVASEYSQRIKELVQITKAQRAAIEEQNKAIEGKDKAIKKLDTQHRELSKAYDEARVRIEQLENELNHAKATAPKV